MLVDFINFFLSFVINILSEVWKFIFIKFSLLDLLCKYGDDNIWGKIIVVLWFCNLMWFIILFKRGV